MKITIVNGRVIDPANRFDKIADVAIENGQIIYKDNIPSSFNPDHTIEAKGCWVIPGLIDICARPQMPHPFGSTLSVEAKAVLQRGITSLCIPPDCDPILDTSAQISKLMQQHQPDMARIYPLGALTPALDGKAIADLTALAEAGCIAFTNGQKPILDLQMLRHCYEYAASFNLLVVIQPQDYWLSHGKVAHEGEMASRLGLAGIPTTAETIAIAQHLLLIEQTGTRAHFTCLSSQGAMELIAKAKEKGLPITADTAMHSLHLSEIDISNFDANCHLYPPLRSIEDKAALIKALAEGTLDAICSDHRPLEAIAKLAPFGESIPGMSTIDTFLSLGLHLVDQHQLDLMSLIAALTSKPAEIFKLPGGNLSTGARADICIVDPKAYWKVDEKVLVSKGKNTAFKGWELPGKVTHTIVEGNIVYAHTR